MSKIQLYHGAQEIVHGPICAFGRDKLDFGKGFYLTDIRSQALQWAKRVVAKSVDLRAILNIYSFDKEGYFSEGHVLIFPKYDEEWLRFIVESRNGEKPWKPYDYIEGGVANDRVIDTVNLYMAGLMDLSTALGRLATHHPNNQICLLNQDLTDKYLKFEGYEYV